MNKIHANTKIGMLIKQHPGALEAIVGISPKFAKLRNPVLRKVIAARTTIAMAAKIGGCSAKDFFTILAPLGFEMDDQARHPGETSIADNPIPGWLKAAAEESITVMDVRPDIEAGIDPLSLITQTAKKLPSGNLLKIINSFVPSPLIAILRKQGFDSFVEIIDENEMNTYFYKQTEGDLPLEIDKPANAGDWDILFQQFAQKLETIDVRNLPMPQPMHKILEALESLPESHALFVYHKRIPVFLLPELEVRQFNYRAKVISDSEVHLLLYKT